ncbi:hypothetical protein [Streptomyces sp. NK15101]|uniref:hypothetical protein n=1 Tax=Streptomyces sp. NK15101 TaxID=2873261 RepID=UPI001CEC7B6E|nr:hypothetical protein [Streptomyces sp. NK15101]
MPARTGPADGSGTVITFRPDAEIFETLKFSFDTLTERFRELAFLSRESEIILADDRDPAAPRPFASASRAARGPSDLREALLPSSVTAWPPRV